MARVVKRKKKKVPDTGMLACLGEEGCDATGFILGHASPVTFAWCIRCKGTGWLRGGPIGPKEIQMRLIGNTPVEHVNNFKRSDFPDNALMAHAMAKAGLFPSIGQARKNGWDKPMETGEWTVSKRKIKVKIT